MVRKLIVTAVLIGASTPPAAASAASWFDVGRITPADRAGIVVADGVDGRGTYTALFSPVVGSEEREHGDPRNVFGPVEGRERRPGGRVVERPGFGAGNATLAVTRSGERLAASTAGPEGDLRVEVRRRLPDLRWSEPEVIARGQRQVHELGIDVASTGEAVVSWQHVLEPNTRHDAVVMAASRPAGATAFGAAEPVGRATFNVTAFDVRMDARGNTVAAWIDRDAGAAQVAQRPAGGDWSTPRPLPVPGRSVLEGSDLALAVTPNGRVALGWNVGRDGEDYAHGVAAAVGTARGAIGPAVPLSERGHSIAVAADDQLAAVSWSEGSGAGGRIRAVLAPDDDDLTSATPTRTVSRTPALYGEVAVARGRATFAWLRRVAGPRVVEARSVTADGRFTRTQTLSSRRHTAGDVLVTTSSRGEPWVTWVGQRRTDNLPVAAPAAKASTRTGRFAPARAVARAPNGPTGLRLLAGRRGTMLAPVSRSGAWYLRAYGER